jgi:hypothetical protein
MSEKGTEGGDGITDAHEISGRLCTSKSGKGNRDWRTKSPSPPHAGMQAGRVMAGMLMMPGPLSGSDLGPLEVTLWKVIARERHHCSLGAAGGGAIAQWSAANLHHCWLVDAFLRLWVFRLRARDYIASWVSCKGGRDGKNTLRGDGCKADSWTTPPPA